MRFPEVSLRASGVPSLLLPLFVAGRRRIALASGADPYRSKLGFIRRGGYHFPHFCIFTTHGCPLNKKRTVKVRFYSREMQHRAAIFLRLARKKRTSKARRTAEGR